MEIVDYHSKLPWGTSWHLRRSLSYINQDDIEGIYCIRLLDQLPEPTDESEEWYSHARANGHEVCGWYTPKEKGTPAYITLHIGDIYRAVPCAYWWTTVPTLLITRVLAHEVAHHLVAKRGYIFRRGERLNHREYEEAAANRYAFSVIERMQERWVYRIGRWLIKDLADHHYIIGMLDWKEKKYSKAADRWYKAWCLNPNLDEAAHWYWRAREMSVPNQK